MPTPETISAFARWWSTEFKGVMCPPCPKSPDDLSFTAQLHMRESNPALFQSLFSNGGQGSAPMPADTVARRNLGQCIAADIPHLEAAGLQFEADQLKRKAEIEETRVMNQRIDESRQLQEMAAQRNREWQSKGFLERLGHEPLDPAVIAANKKRWGIS
jgi:hypothetical protein